MSSFKDLIKNATKEEEDKKKHSSFVEIIRKANASLKSDLAQDDITNWSNSVRDVSQRAYSYLSSEGYKKPDTKLAEEVDKYLSEAGEISVYLRTNKNSYKDYENVYDAYVQYVNGLKSFRDNLKNSNDLFSQFETEKDYEDWKIGWLQPDAETNEETATARKNRYTQNQTRISEIDKELKALKKDGFTTEYERGSRKSVVKYRNQNEIDTLTTEKETLQTENNRYKREQKVLDDYYTPVTPEFLANGADRNYTNASRDELWEVNANHDQISNLLSSGTYKWDDYGNIVNVYTNKIEYAADDLSRAMLKNAESSDPFNGGIFDNDPSDNFIDQYYDTLVQDPLGMFFSASEDDIADAYHEATMDRDGDHIWANILVEGDANAWKELEEHEINIYYNLLKTQGKAAAYKFLKDMTVELTRRATLARQTEIDNASGLELAWKNIESIPGNVFGGVTGFISDAISVMSGQEINPYSNAHAWQNDAQYVRQVTADRIDTATGNAALPWLGTTWGDAYQAIMSAGDSALGLAVGSTAYGTMMGMGAASSEMKHLYEIGASTDQMLAGGLLAGAAEMVFEKYSIDKLVAMQSPQSMKQVLKNFFMQGGIEASEEMATEISNTITNAIVMGSQSDWVDAETFVKKVLNSGLSGFISGGFMGGGGSLVQYAGNQIQNIEKGRSIMDAEGGIDALRTIALDRIQNSSDKARNEISKLSDKVSGEKVKASNVGKLYRATNEANSEQNKADIVKSLERKGFSSKEASSIAEAIVAQSSGQTLTKEQAKLVESLKGDERIAKTLNDVVLNEDSTVGQRTADLSMFDMGIANGVGVSPNIQQTEKNIATKSLKNEVAKVLEDKKIEVADDGKTTNLKTNKAVEIKNIESISESGEANLTLDDRMVVKASDVAFGSEAEALFIGNIGSIKIGNKNISTASANALYQNAMTALKANPNMTATEAMSLIKGLEESYIYGAYNLSKEKLSSKNKDGSATMFAGELTQSQRDSAYELGSQDKVSKVEADQKVIDDLKAKGKASKKSLGKVIFEDGANVDESTLTKTQKANLNGIKLLAELSSVEFHIFKSEKVGNTYRYTAPDGTVNSANGWYVAGTNEIWVDLNAGNFGEGTMIRTAAHEISHYIKQWSPKKWQAMADLLMEEFAKNGVNTESMLNRQIAKIKRRYSKENMPSEAKLLDMAYEELVSDALSDMLTDGSIVNFMAEVKAKDRTLWQKIKDAIENLLKKWGLIIEDYKGRSLDTAEAQALSQLEDTFKKLQAMYQEAFMDANEVVVTIGARNLADFSEAKNTEGESLFQYRAMEADEATYREMLRKWGKMSDAQINNLFTTIDKAMDIIKDNLEVLDYAWKSDIDDRAFSPVKPNSDSLYQVSLDFSTLCRKRLLQQTIQAQLQEALNQPLTREEGIAIRDALVALQEEGRQIEVACALCYVESARMKSPAQIKKFLNNREKVLKDFFAGKSGGTMKAKIDQAVADAREKLHKENPNGIKGKDGSMLDPRTAPLKAMSGKYANTIRDAKKAAKESYKPTAKEQELINVAKGMTVSDFTTPEGLENLAKNYPALFDAYTSYVRNATKSKGIEGDTWWRAGDSQNIGDVLIANMNRENGLRSQSWSDFQVIHILDYIAATIELSTRNAKEQAYSKVPDYVELMGQTGVMINMSLIPTRDFNGKLEYDPTEGIDYNRALALREKYPATAGTICIGIDNKQIQMLLADINIDYVIPYHKSGMAASVRKLMHMPTWSEYEDYQSEKTLSREDAEAQAKKYGATLLAESDPNYHKHTSFSEWFNLKEAKQIAKKENANPTNKAMQEKYGVMYGGYVAMQNAANNYLKLCAERGISPKFSHEKADFTSEDNYWKLLIDRKMVNNATGEIIEQKAIKPIFDEGEVLRILKDELERYPSVKADQDYATRKVTEKFLSGEIKSGMSAEAIAKVMKTPVDNITKTNILASAEGETMYSDRDSSGRELSKGQQKYFAKSKVRDRYGNLLRLFHGSAQGGFTIFDPKKSDDDLSLFFTDTIEMAESYSGSRKPIRTPSPKPNILRWLDGGTKKAGKQQGVYEVYANITNPMIIEAKGRNFNQLSVDAPNTKDVNLKVAGYENDMRIEITIGKENYVEYFYNFDEAMNFVARKLDKGERSRLKAAFFKGGFINIDTSFKWDTERNQRVPYLDIRDIAKIAKERGHDGVIVRDVTDYDNRYGIPEKTPHGTVVVAFKSNQIKDVHNTNPTKRKDIRYSERDLAPTFYSQMGETIGEMKQDKIGATSVVPYLKGRGVKDEEIKWSGIETFLEGKKSITKQELLDFINGSMLQINEEERAETIKYNEDEQKRLNELAQMDNEVYDEIVEIWEDIFKEEVPLDLYESNNIVSGVKRKLDSANLIDTEKGKRLIQLAESVLKIGNEMESIRDATKHKTSMWKDYTLDGGTNYRELVFTMPNSTYTNQAMRAHWGQDAEGILAHARIQDFDVNGKKMLFVEEIQSDWHNAGQKYGYGDNAKALEQARLKQAKLKEEYDSCGKQQDELRAKRYREIDDFEYETEMRKLVEKETAVLNELQRTNTEVDNLEKGRKGSAPDAPFKNNYHEYVLKRLIRMAAEQGYDSIGWTTADIQSERWSDEYAEGYRIEYDQDIPKFLNKYGKKWGARVGKINVTSKDSMKESKIESRALEILSEKGIMQFHWNWSHEYGLAYEQAKNEMAEQGNFVEVWSMPITDSMKESVLYKGQVMYSERDTSTSNRSILANSLESAAQNDIERNKLAQYKEKIALIESEEQRLSEIQKQLFTKGGVATDSISVSDVEKLIKSGSKEIYGYKIKHIYEGKSDVHLPSYTLETPDGISHDYHGSLSKDISRTIAEHIVELYRKDFTKSDSYSRKSLQLEAKQIANRINTYDRQLLNLEATTALKNVLSREKALAMKRQKQKDAEAMRQYKEKVAKTTRELMDRHQESRKKAIEGREKTAMRHKIQKVVSELNTLLLKGSKERNVKLGLQESVAKALEVVNMDTLGADERVAKYDALIAKATDPDVITSLTETRDRIKQQGENLAEKLEAMRNAYAEIRRNSNNDYAQYYQQEAELIEYVIEDVIKKVGNTSIRDMSLSQLEAVYDMYKVVLQTIQYANKLYTEGKVEELRKNASDMMAELKKIKTLKEERAALGDKFREFSWNELIPIYAVRRTGSKVLEKFFWETIKGQSTFARDLDEADVFKSAIREKYGHSKWDLNKVHEFKLKDGRTFRLTLEHMMSIYAYSKREQALDHMTEGGFFFNDKATFRRKGGVLEIVKSNEVGYAIDQDILNEITATMEKEAKGSIQYVDEMQDYLTKMGEKGNEVSRVVWGIDIFKEKIYFPLKSSKDFIFQANQPVQETSLKHDGMTKETKPGASNPIILEAFDEVWSNHVIRMSQYHGFVIPIDNMNKLLNYGSWAGTDSISVSTMLRARFSEAVNEYFNQFIKDMNGASSTSGAANPFFSFVGKFKKTAVAASMSVVAQQPTAILRAMAVMNPKYFAGLPKARRLSTAWSEMREYAPIATIKEIGGFEMGGGRTAAEWLNSDTKRGVDRVSNKIDDITMKGAAIGDQIGWCAIWEAVKREIKDTTNLKEGTEEFLQRVGERATEVIVLTQVYDSTLSRSGYMRSKHDSVKMLTSFLGEPTVSLNMMQDATLQAKRKTFSKARAGRIIGATYASVIAASVAASLIYALRDDDDDESYAEKFAEAFGGKILGDINPLNMLPGIRDIFSIFDGWDVERTDVAIFKDIKDAFDGLFSENKSPWRKVEDFAGAISSAFGIPGKNLLRTGREIYNGITNIFDDITPSRVGDAFIRGITGEKKDKGEALYNAIISGDDARLGVYRKGYKDEKAYETAVRSALRENDPRIKEAAEARIDGDIAEYTRIVKAIKGEGNFVQDTIVAAVNAEINALNKGEDSSSSSDKAKSMYTMDDYFMALDGGDEATAYLVKEDLIQTDVANGKDREEAEESFISKFTSHLREQYEEGGISDYEAQRMLIDYGDKSEEEAASKVQYWDFKQEYPDYDDLSEEAVAKYYDEVEPHGIDVDVYYDYSKQRSKCKGVDANGDGKTDSGSKKAEIMQVINSLPISRSQKDVLYYLNGWSAKTIYEAPWH